MEPSSNALIPISVGSGKLTLGNEDIPPRTYINAEEQRCDDHFLATYSRTTDGRYLVRLPFKSDPPLPLGESRRTAVSSFQRLEQRFQRISKLASEYQAFMREYEYLGHGSSSPDRTNN